MHPASSGVSAQAAPSHWNILLFPPAKPGAYPLSKSCSRLSFSTDFPCSTPPPPMCVQFYGAELSALVSVRCNLCSFPVWEVDVQFNFQLRARTTLPFSLPFSSADGKGKWAAQCNEGQGQRLRAFLPFGPHPLIWGNVNGVSDGIMTDSQAQVCNGTHAIFLH